MASVFLFVFLFLSHLVSLYLAVGEEKYFPGCPPFFCGKVGKIRFPFANDTSPECGLLILHDCGDPHQMKTPKIKLERDGTVLSYDVETISEANIIKIKDRELQSVLDSNSCESLKNWTLPSPSSPFISFQRVQDKLTLFKCNRALNICRYRLLSAEILLEVRMTEGCRECYIKGGQCKIDHKGKAYCTKGTKGNNRSRVVALGKMPLQSDILLQ
uniref:Wall-associated receptor kinase galacturonan-binding domain-containing protein n=1 Tax=Quercus lobata TaxID=97700 RepID=A0A7N2LRG2_QUELO